MNDSLNNSNSQYINSIIRASEILNLYRILDVPSLGISEISRHLKLGKTTVFRIVKTLEKEEKSAGDIVCELREF